MEQQRKGRRTRLTALAAAISAASAPAVADTFEVTNTAPFGEGSLAAAINQANGTAGTDSIVFLTAGTISLAGGYTLPTVSEGVTITGSGNVTIDADGGSEFGVFKFNTGEAPGSSLSGLRITNARYGAVSVYNESGLSVSDLVITGSGDAVNPTESALVSVFSEADLTITDSTFSGNVTGESVLLVGGEGSTLRLEDSLLRDNTKYGGGGAALAVYNDASADVIASTFSGNTTAFTGEGSDGGAVYALDGGELYVEGSTFDGNSSIDDGGAIAVWNSSAEIRNSEFRNNVSYDAGGAIYVDEGSLTVYDSVFSKNLLKVEPEAPEPFSAMPRTPLEDLEEGGAIYGRSASIEVFRTTLTGNKAHKGGAIYGYETTINVVNSRITNNSALHGGGIHSAEGGSVTVTGSTLTGNTAIGSGGAIYAYGGDVSLFESSIRNNSGADDGGGLFGYNNNLTIQNTAIVDNSSEDGAGILGDNVLNVYITDSVISGNTGEVNPALQIDFDESPGHLSIRGTTIADNRASDGPALKIDLDEYNTGFIVDSTISGNVGVDDPAVRLRADYQSELYIYNSTFSANRANGYRVAIETYAYDLTMRNTTLVDNVGQGNGTAQMHVMGAYGEGNDLQLQNSILSSANDHEAIIGGIFLESSGDIFGAPDLYAELTANIMTAGFVVAPAGASTGGSFGAIPTDPQLGPLADNGGRTRTHAPTSAAAPGINEGLFSRPDGKDQRGAETVGQADLGAVEYTDNTPPRLVSNLTGSLSGTVNKVIEPIVVLDYFVDDEGDDLTVDNVIGLPAGLNFNEGAIGGTLIAAGEYPVSITVSDDGEPSLSRTVAATVKVRESAPAVFFIDDDDSSGSVPLAGLSLLGALAWLRRRRYG